MTHLHALPHAAVTNGWLYGYGRTYDACRADVRSQLAGATAAVRANLLNRLHYIILTDELASEVEEMLAAPVLEWRPT